MPLVTAVGELIVPPDLFKNRLGVPDAVRAMKLKELPSAMKPNPLPVVDALNAGTPAPELDTVTGADRLTDDEPDDDPGNVLP